MLTLAIQRSLGFLAIVVVKGVEGEGTCAISLLVAVYVVYNVVTIGVARSKEIVYNEHF